MRLDREPRDRCLCCGAYVDPNFGRTHGDDENRVHRCPECDVSTRLRRGSAAGRDVGLEDPLDQPGRFHESREDLYEGVRSLIERRKESGDQRGES